MKQWPSLPYFQWIPNANEGSILRRKFVKKVILQLKSLELGKIWDLVLSYPGIPTSSTLNWDFP